MIRLTQIQANGVKGSNARHSVKPVTVFTGANGSGKTTMLHTVSEVLSGSGRFRWLGRSTNPMQPDRTVAGMLTFVGDEGLVSIQRQFYPDHQVALMPGPQGVKKCAKWIDQHIGPRVDVTDFLGLSAAARETMLMQLAAEMPQGWPGAAEVVDMLGDVGPMLVAAHAPPPANRSAEAWATWITAALSQTGKLKRASEAQIKAIESDLERIATTDTDAPSGTLAEADAECQRLREALASSRGALSAFDGVGSGVADARARVEALTAERDALAAQQDETIPESFGVAVEAAKSLMRAADERAARYNEADRAYQLANMEHASALVAAEAAEKAEAKAAEALSRYVDGHPCGECGQPLDVECDGYQRAAGRLDENGSVAVTLREQVQRMAPGVSQLKSAVQAVRDEGPWPIGLEALQKSLNEAARAAVLESDRIAKAAATRSHRIGSLTSQIEAIETTLAGIPSGADPVILRARVEADEVTLEAAEVKAAALRRVQAREEERTAKLTRKALLRTAVDGWRDALDRLGELRAQLVSSVSGRVVEDANDLFGRVFSGALRVESASAGGVVLGIEREGVMIPLQAWSDSETVVAGLAFHLTRLRASGAPWRAALVDNVDRLDADTLPRLVRALASWHADDGAFDNVLMAAAIDGERLREDLTYIPAAHADFVAVVSL